MTTEEEWMAVLSAFAHLGVGVYRHPVDTCKRVPDPARVANLLAVEGSLARSPATHYFAITEAGMALARMLPPPWKLDDDRPKLGFA